MMSPFKILVFSFCLLFPVHFSGAVSFDWSGWARLESYYQHEDNYYGNFHFVLNSDLFITDNLSFKSRLDLLPFFEEKKWTENLQLLESAYRQTGYVFLYKEKGKTKQSEFPLAFILPSQFYVDYQEEFFKIRLGRAPYHFGLGTTYSAESNPFSHWISLYNQVSLHIEHSLFYLQPALLHDVNLDSSLEGQLFLALQAGISKDNWKLSTFSRYDFEHFFIELFGEYKKALWDLKSSASYLFKPGSNFSLALEGKTKWYFHIPIQLELKAGGLSGDIAFHPNYNLALLFWNRWMSDKEISDSAYPYQIAGGQAQKAIYISPRVLFSFLDETFQIQPLFLLAGDLEDKSLSYEFDLQAKYKWQENLFFSLTTGALYSKEKLYLSLLAKTAASF